MNKIIVNLPNVDGVTGKSKKAEMLYFQITNTLDMKISRKITFWENDLITPAIEDPKSRLKQFEPVEVPGTTEGNFVDPATGFNLVPTFDEQGNITNGAVSELVWWQNIPLSKALPSSVPQALKDQLDTLGIKAADILYGENGMIQQALIGDNLQGIY